MTSPLNALEFSADEGLRDGRQKGSETNIGRAALTGRAEYVGVRGLTAGVSFWTGKSGFELRPRFDVPVHLIEADARYSRDRLELRGQIASVDHRQRRRAERRDRPHDRRRSRTSPRTLRGAYAEASYRVVDGQRWGDVGVFARYENFDTQFRMPAGAVPLPAVRSRRLGGRRHLLAGARHRGQGRLRRSRATRARVVRAPNAFNIGLGWWF